MTAADTPTARTAINRASTCAKNTPSVSPDGSVTVGQPFEAIHEKHPGTPISVRSMPQPAPMSCALPIHCSTPSANDARHAHIAYGARRRRCGGLMARIQVLRLMNRQGIDRCRQQARRLVTNCAAGHRNPAGGDHSGSGCWPRTHRHDRADRGMSGSSGVRQHSPGRRVRPQAVPVESATVRTNLGCSRDRSQRG